MIYLYTSHYDEPDAARRKELNTCLHRNCQTSLSHLFLLCEPASLSCVFPDKVYEIKVPERPKYADYIAYINIATADSDINIIANSDVYVTSEALKQIDQRLDDRTVIALSRWDVAPDGSAALYDHKDSQDLWAWRGKLTGVPGRFEQGKRGCDNRIAYEMLKAGYQVINPARTIKCFHLHNSGVRHYGHGDKDLVRGPYYCPEVTA